MIPIQNENDVCTVFYIVILTIANLRRRAEFCKSGIVNSLTRSRIHLTTDSSAVPQWRRGGGGETDGFIG